MEPVGYQRTPQAYHGFRKEKRCRSDRYQRGPVPARLAALGATRRSGDESPLNCGDLQHRGAHEDLFFTPLWRCVKLFTLWFHY